MLFLSLNNYLGVAAHCLGVRYFNPLCSHHWDHLKLMPQWRRFLTGKAQYEATSNHSAVRRAGQGPRVPACTSYHAQWPGQVWSSEKWKVGQIALVQTPHLPAWQMNWDTRKPAPLSPLYIRELQSSIPTAPQSLIPHNFSNCLNGPSYDSGRRCEEKELKEYHENLSWFYWKLLSLLIFV